MPPLCERTTLRLARKTDLSNIYSNTLTMAGQDGEAINLPSLDLLLMSSSFKINNPHFD